MGSPCLDSVKIPFLYSTTLDGSGKGGKRDHPLQERRLARGGRKGSFADERVRLGMFSSAQKSLLAIRSPRASMRCALFRTSCLAQPFPCPAFVVRGRPFMRRRIGSIEIGRPMIPSGKQIVCGSRYFDRMKARYHTDDRSTVERGRLR